MSLTKNQIVIIGVAGLVILFFVLLFLGVIPGLKSGGNGGGLTLPNGPQVQLTFWGVSDAGDRSAVQTLIDEYLKIDKSLSISYRYFDNADTYEKTLINALATNQGPDIFMLKNGWLLKHFAKASPIADTSLSLSQFRQLFPKVAEQDFVLNQKIYSLPLYIDTLALIYNKDLFDASSIALLPKTWSDFQSLIPKLKKINVLNQITKPAAAIGGSSKSIDTASDMLNLLITQMSSSSQFVNSYGEINFGQDGLSAFNFYLQFSDPNNQLYTWNDNLTPAIDNLSQSQTAIIFNYYSSLPLIKQKNPYLNIGSSLMPQFDLNQPVNWANYWGLSVSTQSKQKTSAWQFILAATANPQISEAYLQAAKKPPALRTLIDKYKNDADLGVFAQQALTARSWPQPDGNAVKEIFSNAIQSVLIGRLNSKQALDQAQSQINELK